MVILILQHWLESTSAVVCGISCVLMIKQWTCEKMWLDDEKLDWVNYWEIMSCKLILIQILLNINAMLGDHKWFDNMKRNIFVYFQVTCWHSLSVKTPRCCSTVPSPHTYQSSELTLEDSQSGGKVEKIKKIFNFIFSVCNDEALENIQTNCDSSYSTTHILKTK